MPSSFLDRTQHIHSTHPIIPHKPIQIHPTRFTQRIAAEPSSLGGVVGSVAVVVLAGEVVDGFGAEAPGVALGEGAGGLEEVAEGVVVVGGGSGAGGAVD
jgi:hypothetical protein